MARYGQTDVLLLMISVNSDPNPEKNHFGKI